MYVLHVWWTRFPFLQYWYRAPKTFKALTSNCPLTGITLYMSFLYGILYLNFVAYPIIFELGHGMNAGISGLMFLPLFLGSIAAACFSIFYINPRYISKSAAWPPYKAPPELRLESALPGAVILPISMFWLAWTSYDVRSSSSSAFLDRVFQFEGCGLTEGYLC